MLAHVLHKNPKDDDLTVSHELLNTERILMIFQIFADIYDFLNVTGSDSLNTYKMHYELYYV